MRIVALPSGQRVLQAPGGKQYNDVAEARQVLQPANKRLQTEINRQNGVEFESQVIEALSHVGGVKNTALMTVPLSNGVQVTTVPDLWGKSVGGLIEVKNVQNLSMSDGNPPAN
jgi:filamentous hemagglutinin